MDRKFVTSILITAVSLTISFSGQTQAAPTSDDFSSGLIDWTLAGQVEHNPEGVAILREFTSGDAISSMYKTFSILSDSQNLSFDLRMETDGGPNCDEFTASLSGLDFYFLDETGLQITDAQVDNIGDGWRRVTLDVSSLAPQDVVLKFNLLGDLNDEDGEQLHLVFLDNVLISGSTSVVPAPAALPLAAIGLGLVGLFRRSKILG